MVLDDYTTNLIRVADVIRGYSLKEELELSLGLLSSETSQADVSGGIPSIGSSYSLRVLTPTLGGIIWSLHNQPVLNYVLTNEFHSNNWA